MSSLIERYNYDIFISYRQKDNKYDGWVTEFVENLKKELEATYKEDISVYFDINPHDGILETHDVDASLKKKLKCLIFIPIISRTYCDPKSFAWEHEFKAFVEQASQDKFGLKIKLPNGNVASRVLPVRIYDLDISDIKLCESVLGGMLRGIDFIYKSAGVNRPLRSKEEKLLGNLSNTLYRDQINKVANSICEIILGLSTDPAQGWKEIYQPEDSYKFKKDVDERKEKQQNSHISVRRRWITVATISLLIILVAILIYPKIFSRDKLEELKSSGEKISVAVMPFQNMTNDTTWNIWQEGIQDILITSLSNSEEFKVRQAQPVKFMIQSEGHTDYTTITPAKASRISQKLESDIFICGTIKQAGRTIRVNAQLTDTKTKEIFKSFQLEGAFKEDMIFSIIDSLSNQVKNFILIGKLQKRVSGNLQNYVSTNSPEAYRYYIHGAKAMSARDLETSSNLLLKAIAADSNFIWASYILSYGYYRWGRYDQAKELAVKLYGRKDHLPLQLNLWVNYLYSILFGTPHERLSYLTQLEDLDDQSPDILLHEGLLYCEIKQYENAIPPLEKALKLYNRWGVKPEWIDYYEALGKAYHKTGKYREEKRLYKRAEKDFSDNPILITRQMILLLSCGDSTAAEEYVGKYISIRKKTYNESYIMSLLGDIYSEGGYLDKAEVNYRKSVMLQPDNHYRLNNLAYFLIDNDINVDEGLALIEIALEADPENFIFLDTKGWGLYKSGKYNEAQEVLAKSWELKPIYDHDLYLHLEAAKKAVANHKNY